MKALRNRYGRLAGHLLALILSVMASSPPLMAQEYGIIDDVNIMSSPQGPQIRISFTKPAQYIGHTPEEESRQLFIDLRLVGAAPTDVLVPQQQQLRIRPTAEAPLTAVSYREEGRDRARLELSFNPLWFSMLICILLQTSFLTPPFGYALFYFAGAAPEGRFKMMDISLIQIFGMMIF